MLALATLLAALLGSPAVRQDPAPVQNLDPEYSEKSVGMWLPPASQASDPRFRSQVLARYAGELEAGRYGFVLKQLADEFRSSGWPSHADVKAKFQRQMDALVAKFEAALVEHVPAGTVETLEQRSRMIDALKPRGAESLLPEKVFHPPGTEDTALVFFAGDEADRIVTYERVPGQGYRLLVPRDLVLDLRLRGDSVAAVFEHFIRDVQDHNLEAIRAADRQWQNYLQNGYSQYPWESLFNGAVLDYDAFHPPDAQWILFHPTVGLEASTAVLDEITADEVVNLELIGYLRYYGEDRGNYIGGSIAATFKDSSKPGIGVIAHVWKGWSLGVTWHDLDGDDEWFDDEPGILLSLDLFRFLQTEGPAFKEKRDGLRKLAGNF